MINKKLGYYTVNGLEFDSKLRACFFSQAVGGVLQWHFNDEVFEKYDWSIEPVESLDRLYDLRSKQIRDSYDYVIISFSGGSDSLNIVESFIRQGLHIDEIVVNTTEKAGSRFNIANQHNLDPKYAQHAEHVFQTIPRLKEIEKRIPKTKISILDLSDYLLNSWLEIGDASWVMDKREGLNPLNVTRFNYLHFDSIRRSFDKTKKLGLILGVEKPRTYINSDNKFFIRFNDRATNIITIENHIKDYDNAVVEYFYWSPDSVELLCKQAHVIKRWLEFNPEKQPYWFHKNLNADLYRLVHERELRPLLYSTWRSEFWQADKATLDWYSEFDTWFIEGFKGTKQHAIWQQGIDYVRRAASQYVNRSRGFDDGLVGFAKNYEVARMSTNLDPKNLIWKKS
jgi:hypothetical protein